MELKKFLRCRRIHRYGRTTVLSTQWSRPAMGSCLRWLFTHGRAAVHDCLSLSSCADERRTDHMAILPPTLHPHRTTIFHLHDTIQYPANVMGAAKWRNLLKRSVTDIPELPDTGRTPVVHVPSDQPLLIHTHNIAMAEKSHGKRRTFLHRIVLIINMYTLSKPLVRWSMGTMFLERIPHVVVLLRLLGLSCTGTLHTCPSHLEPFQTSHCRNYFNGRRSNINHLLFLCPSHTRRNSPYTRNRNRMGFLHNQLCTSHSGYIPSFYMYKQSKSPTAHYRNIETQLWHVSYAHILARVMGYSVQTYTGTSYCRCYTMYRCQYIHLLLRNCKDHLIHPGQ